MTAAELDLDAIEQRGQRTANERHCWANESGIVDRDVIAGLRRAKELAVDDVPALVREVRHQRAELDSSVHQQQALQHQVDSLVREVRRLQHAERRASRHAIARDKEVAEANAFVAARDAEIARCKAVEAALRLELHDATADAEDLRTRLKATSNACNDAENRLHTMTAVARSNRRHSAVHVELLERVEKFAAELGPEVADRLRNLLAAPSEAERARPEMKPDDTAWAVKVTKRDGTVSLRHDQDLLLSRVSAEQIAEAARRHPAIADARPVCRDVWHGPWTTPPADKPNDANPAA